MTPTQRSLKLLRDEGWTAEIVERWNSHARVRHDLFGCIDILAIRDGETLAVQTTSGSGVAARIKKIADSAHIGAIRKAGWSFHVHGWRKVKLKPGGKATRWQPRIVDVS
jgi:hypothetical protein